ncbi:MAG: phasin family protein [Alphaproteobacteria bacterium]
MAGKTNGHGDFDFAKMFSQFKLPGVDTAAVLEAQRKNFEALSTAGKLATEGFQAVAQRQTELVRQGVEQSMAAVREVMAEGSFAAQTAKQAEIAKRGYESTLSNVSELNEMVLKANQDAFGVISKRIGEVMDEVKALAKAAA